MSLAHLPAELLHATLTHLAPKDLAAVAAASRTLKRAAYDERLWAAAVKGKARSQQCGAAILTPSSRLWYAKTRTRCVHCQPREFPVQTTNYRRLEELRRLAQHALSLSRDQSAQIQASLRRSKSRISVAVWPTPHGARVWMADDSRLDPDELRLLCSREAVEGWTRLTNGLTGGGEAVVRWDWENGGAGGFGWNEDVEQAFLVKAVKTSDLARYLPPFRAPTVEARLQIEMRAKEIGLQRILLDGDCVFGFCLGYMDCVQYGSRADAPPPPMNFTDVLMCQRSSDRHDLLFVADNHEATHFDHTAFGPPDPAAHAAWNAVVNHAVNHGV